MKNIVLSLATATIVLSCQDIPAGGNHGVLELKDGVERYDTNERRYEDGEVAATITNHDADYMLHDDTRQKVDVDLNGTKLKGYKGGFEEGIIVFLKSDDYKNAADDNALKDKWYSFDNVNFKMNSSNVLLDDSMEQVENLAKILKAYPDAKIKVGGYTDKTGNEEINKRISNGRARFIKSQLTKLGVGDQVVDAEGYGSEFATVPADASDAERAVDRKMAVRFVK